MIGRMNSRCGTLRRPLASYPTTKRLAPSTITARQMSGPAMPDMATVEAMSAAELHDHIMSRFDELSSPPPKSHLLLLGSAGDASLLLSAHKRYVQQQMMIGREQKKNLIETCIRGSDWDALEEVLTESRQLQLFSRSADELLLPAFDAIAKAGELERLEQLHARLPEMAVDQLCTSSLHSAVVTALADEGHADAAARALGAAVAMTSGSGVLSSQTSWCGNFVAAAARVALLQAEGPGAEAATGGDADGEAAGEEQSTGESNEVDAAEAEPEVGGPTPSAEELFVEMTLHATSEAKSEALVQLEGVALPEWMAAALAHK